jgi:hypothetical protein
MRFAYADPPYPGQAVKHYSHDPRCAEVDYNALMAEMCEQYDGWAMSLGSVNLYDVLRMPNMPRDHHIGAWVKPFAAFKANVNPAYTWEPVIFWGGRRIGRDVPTVKDHVIESITLRRGLSGAKPHRFSVWLFEMLGMQLDDELVDLFPGTGAVTEAWQKWLEAKSRQPIKLTLAI